MPSKSCPTCRAQVTGSIPSYFARETIGLMEVNCPNDGSDDSLDESRKRSRGNDGEAMPTGDGCKWKGKCQDLQNHKNVCEFKVVTCDFEGCHHQCRRKDMMSHLSGGGLIRHMNLMKESIEAGYKKEIDSMKKENDGTKKEIANLKQKASASDKKVKSMQKELANLKANNT
jgi:hypothetical protein